MKLFRQDTIAAISTPPGTGGISIIRISGHGAVDVAKTVFKNKEGKKIEQFSNRIFNYGHVIDPDNGEIIDEVLLVYMKEPSTYTKEDIIEINCHGGNVTVRRIMDLVLKSGARPAEPGEFTKRAFLNGRIDLAQAEAVIGIINAKTEASAKASLNQLEGRLSQKIRQAGKRLIELIAHIEATFDYPEHDIEEITAEKTMKSVKEIKPDIERLLEESNRGRLIKEGIKTAIAGKPNVGKSSLLNEITGENKAIVTEIPGTTRDIKEEFVEIKGVPLRVIDTAGIRETGDIVEKIGVERAEKAIRDADLVLFVIDGSRPVDGEDKSIAEKIKEKKVIVLINKSDLEPAVDEEEVKKIVPDVKVIKISAREGTGMDELEKEITDLFFKGSVQVDNEILITDIRHRELIRKTLESLECAEKAYESGMPLDCMAVDIKNAAEYLGEITGDSVNEDMVNEIFSKFCIGK